MLRLRGNFFFHLMLALLLCLSTAVTARPCNDQHASTSMAAAHPSDSTAAVMADDLPCHAMTTQDASDNTSDKTDTELSADCCSDGNCAKCCIAPFGLTGTNDTVFIAANHPPYHGHNTIPHDYRADRPEHPPKPLLRFS